MSLESRLGKETFDSLDTSARSSIQRLVDSLILIPAEGFLGRTNVIGLGGDLCHIPTMEEEMRETPALLRAVFDQSEVAYSMIQVRPAASLAARFAAKEAAFKACGFRFRDFVVVHEVARNPSVRLEGSARERASRLGVGAHLLTLSSHEGDYAMAVYAALQIIPDEDFDPIDIPGRE